MVGKVEIPKIVGIGEVVSDIFPDSRKLGGAPADFLHYAVKDGAEGYLISAIGADDLGRELVAELNKLKINPVLSVTPYPTGRVLIFNNPNGYFTSHILENSAWDFIPYTSAAENCIKKADAVYFGTLALRKAYSENTILDLIDAAPARAYKFFDVNLRQNYYSLRIIRKLLEKADILKLNAEELKIIKNILSLTGSPENICLKLKETYQLKYVILTNMAKESFIWGDDCISSLQNGQLQQTFAYGAGNAFAGTFMSALLRGYTLHEAHEKANQTAIEVCLATQKS